MQENPPRMGKPEELFALENKGNGFIFNYNYNLNQFNIINCRSYIICGICEMLLLVLYFHLFYSDFQYITMHGVYFQFEINTKINEFTGDSCLEENS